jgi:hypothetical protein
VGPSVSNNKLASVVTTDGAAVASEFSQVIPSGGGTGLLDWMAELKLELSVVGGRSSSRCLLDRGSLVDVSAESMVLRFGDLGRGLESAWQEPPTIRAGVCPLRAIMLEMVSKGTLLGPMKAWRRAASRWGRYIAFR